MKKRRKNGFRNYRFIYISFIFLGILLLSVGFSAFQNNLSINDANATVRVDKDIRIMGISIDRVNDATSSYEEYNVSNVTSKINLDNNNSYVIFSVDIYNLGNVLMGIKDISINYDNLKVEILNYDLKSRLCDESNQCTLGMEKKLEVKVSYQDGGYQSSNTSYDIRLDFLFGRIYSISYYDIDATNLPHEIMEGEELNITIPNHIDYFLNVFMNNTRLSNESDYQYKNDILILPNVNGDIRLYFKMPLCQRATILHTEECKGNYCASAGYKADGIYGTTTITYGSLGATGNLVSGDAFDCDVNGDGTYDAETERFYYVTDMENNSNVAVLIYYNNVSEGKPNNEKYYPYDSSKENWHGPRTAMEQLPTTSQWSNVSLFNTERKLINEYGTTSTKDGHTFPEVLSYSKYAARLLTIAEVKKLVTFYIPTWKNGELDSHLYLAENTNFSKKDNSKFDGYWLETPRNTMSNHGWIIYATARRVHSVEVQRTDVLVGVRPVIEVYKSDIDY